MTFGSLSHPAFRRQRSYGPFRSPWLSYPICISGSLIKKDRSGEDQTKDKTKQKQNNIRQHKENRYEFIWKTNLLFYNQKLEEQRAERISKLRSLPTSLHADIDAQGVYYYYYGTYVYFSFIHRFIRYSCLFLVFLFLFLLLVLVLVLLLVLLLFVFVLAVVLVLAVVFVLSLSCLILSLIQESRQKKGGEMMSREEANRNGHENIFKTSDKAILGFEQDQAAPALLEFSH